MINKKVYPMKSLQFNQAFTLIELLVVIAIVGVLSGFIFVSMTSAINSAKDAKRKADLSSLEKALLVYGVNHGGTYPYSALDTYPCNLTGSTNPCTNTNLSSALSPYLGVLPTDPNGTSYTYTGTSDASSFVLTGTLSNGNSYYYSSPNLTWTEGRLLTGWSYRKSCSITGSTAGAQTNYQVKFVVHRGTGTDSGQDIYIDTSKLDASYKDLRFTGSDKTTLLDYWIESSSSSSATVWVELPSIPASPSTAQIYVYYGNAGAVAIDRDTGGNATFPFFDDFNGTSLSSKWSTVPSQGYSVSGSSLTFNFNTSNWNTLAENAFTVSSGYLVTTYENYVGYSGSTIRGWFNAWGTGPMTNWDTWSGTGLHLRNAWEDSGALIYSGTGWHKVEKYFDGSATQYVRVDGGSWSSRGGGAIGSTGGLTFGAYSTSAGGYHYFDYIYIRKYASSEPAQSAYGTEESF